MAVMVVVMVVGDCGGVLPMATSLLLTSGTIVCSYSMRRAASLANSASKEVAIKT
jgi:hypothetical protein